MEAEGIVLKSVDYRDKQKIIQVFTAEVGIISLMVYGISPAKTHLLNLTSPLSRIRFTYEKGRGDLYRFQEGQTLDLYPEIRASYPALQAAGQLIRLLRKSQLPEKPAPALFALFSSYLKKLPLMPEILSCSFSLKLLLHEGILPFSSFSDEELELLLPLASARSFSELQKLPLPEPLIPKINFIINENF